MHITVFFEHQEGRQMQLEAANKKLTRKMLVLKEETIKQNQSLIAIYEIPLSQGPVQCLYRQEVICHASVGSLFIEIMGQKN